MSALVVFGVVTIGAGTAGLPNNDVVVVGIGVVPLGSDFFLLRPAKEKKCFRKRDCDIFIIKYYVVKEF